MTKHKCQSRDCICWELRRRCCDPRAAHPETSGQGTSEQTYRGQVGGAVTGQYWEGTRIPRESNGCENSAGTLRTQHHSSDLPARQVATGRTLEESLPEG